MRLWGRLGNTFLFGADSVGCASRLFAQYGKLVTIVHGGGTHIYSPEPTCPGTVLCYGVEASRQIAAQHDVYHKAALSGRLRPEPEAGGRLTSLAEYGTGLFSLNGDEHRTHRRLLAPSFSNSRLPTYAGDMVAITEDCLSRWRPGEPLELSLAMEDVTRRIATKTLFGEDAGQGGTGSLIQRSLRQLASPWTRLLPYDLPGFPYHAFLNTTRRLETTIRQIVQRKRERHRDDGDVLSLLVKARDEESGLSLTEAQLMGHVGVLFAAGHETSANGLTWTLFLLSQHPRVHADVSDEVWGLLRGAAPRIEQLDELPLLDAVVKESLRLLPPVPWNARITSVDTQLLGRDLPAGTEVFFSIYETHHCPELYERPRQFDPGRWQRSEPEAFAYVPFSAGSRKCLGAAFALLEIKIVLSMILQRFRLELLPARRIDRVGHIVMAPKHGMAMRVHQRDRRYQQGVGRVRGNVREMVELP
ncbi:MAG: cytochrome P450 [Pirellulaceae bacterium]|nr:cytochrome P450 [Pirellulaceae bacterium]